jgi:hypothetical protein
MTTQQVLDRESDQRFHVIIAWRAYVIRTLKSVLRHLAAQGDQSAIDLIMSRAGFDPLWLDQFGVEYPMPPNA